jgi:ABC-type phosphate transport system ATPase subunit
METKSSTSEFFVKDLVVTIKNKDSLHGVNMLACSADLLAAMGPTGKEFFFICLLRQGVHNITLCDKVCQ